MSGHHVYLMIADGTNLCKVGITKKSLSPGERKKGVQTGNPFNLEVLYSYYSDYGRKIETILHRQYSMYKENEYDGKELNGEWFCFPDEVMDNFILECAKIDDQIKSMIENSTFDNPLKYL